MATAQIISHRKGLWMHELYSTRVKVLVLKVPMLVVNFGDKIFLFTVCYTATLLSCRSSSPSLPCGFKLTKSFM